MTPASRAREEAPVSPIRCCAQAASSGVSDAGCVPVSTSVPPPVKPSGPWLALVAPQDGRMRTAFTAAPPSRKSFAR